MTELQAYYFEDLTIGLAAVFSRTVTETDVIMFSGISGDTNPLHLNDEYASCTRFKGRIAQGMLVAGFISAAFSTKLPGQGCVYVTQNLRFKAPVRIGDTVHARVEVTALLPEKKRAQFKTTCSVGGIVVIDGDATMMVPSRG
jgi:3-hydroxybutyryl-CoA dehydratase